MGIKDLFNKVKNKILPQNDKSVSASEYTIEDEIATMESYTTPKGYIMEDNLRNQHKEDRSPLLSLRVHLIIWGYGDEKLPTNYFCQLVDRLHNAICKDAFAYDYVIDMLCKQAKTFIMDENGEVSDRKNKLSSKEIISLSDNPVLEYASKFNYFEFADDIYGTVDNKRIVFMKVILFLAINSGADESVPVNRNILKDNPWLLDKDTYYNKLGMVKDEKSFLKYCYEMSGNDCFKILYEKL